MGTLLEPLLRVHNLARNVHNAARLQWGEELGCEGNVICLKPEEEVLCVPERVIGRCASTGQHWTMPQSYFCKESGLERDSRSGT